MNWDLFDQVKADINAITFAQRIQEASDAAWAQGCGVLVDYDKRTAEPNAHIRRGEAYLISLEGQLPKRGEPDDGLE